jgi:hypothetical protein
MKRGLFALMLMVFFSALLGGCASVRLIDSDVTAFSAWITPPPAPGTPYRFERLPSQLQPSGFVQQDRIEEIARTSLARVGMDLAPDTARFSVQVILNTQALERFPDDSLFMGGPGVFFGAGNRGGLFGMSFPIRFGEPYYKRDVTLLIRELATQKVVFETRALHEGPWGDTLAVLPAMLDSALLGFPQPPAGTRRVNTEIHW